MVINLPAPAEKRGAGDTSGFAFAWRSHACVLTSVDVKTITTHAINSKYAEA
jgi:hypothetical protein